MKETRDTFEFGFRIGEVVERTWDASEGDTVADLFQMLGSTASPPVSDFVAFALNAARQVYRVEGLPVAHTALETKFRLVAGEWISTDELPRLVRISISPEGLMHLPDGPPPPGFADGTEQMESRLWETFGRAVGSLSQLAGQVIFDSTILALSAESGDLAGAVAAAVRLTTGIHHLEEMTLKIRGKSLGAIIASGIASHIIAPIAGKRSALVRRENAENTWMRQAREWALDIRKLDPSIPQDELAAEIRDKWELKDRPPHSRLLRFVRRAEREGTIPRRVPKK